jgi:hypothetical protein
MSLKAATGKTEADTAKALATPEQKNTASDYATKAKNSRGFESLPNGEKKDSFICKDCKEQVRAQVNVSRYMRD